MSLPVLLHSKKQAAVILGISERGLHALIATKQLKVRRVGRRVLVPQSELKKFAQVDHRNE
jgi:excisionase family DNA binding protein